MVGDSFTDFAQWQELFPGKNIGNRGIAGDRIEGVLLRVGSIVDTQAETAFVMMGRNDVTMSISLAQILANYEKVLSALWETGMHIYVQPALFGHGSHAHFNLVIEQLNRRLAQLAAGQEGVDYVDVNSALSSAEGELDAAYTTDGIHLNGEGYRVWKEKIEALMP